MRRDIIICALVHAITILAAAVVIGIAAEVASSGQSQALVITSVVPGFIGFALGVLVMKRRQERILGSLDAPWLQDEYWEDEPWYLGWVEPSQN